MVLLAMNSEPIVSATMSLGEKICESPAPFGGAATTARSNHLPGVSQPKPLLLHHARVSISSSTNAESSNSLTSDDFNHDGGLVDSILTLQPPTSTEGAAEIALQQRHGQRAAEDSNGDSLHITDPKNSKIGDSADDSSFSSSSCLVDPTNVSIKKVALVPPPPCSMMKPKRKVSDDNNQVADSANGAHHGSSSLGGPTKKKARGNGANLIKDDSSGGSLVPSPQQPPVLFPPPTATTVAATTTAAASPNSFLLLARPTDDVILSPLHGFVRKQIEVFTATAEDLQLPCPGRKNPIQLHQVGLRCIHCRHVPIRDRVKRAICYPSSLGRVYHSASDMKCDHFSSCKALPDELRAEFQRLKGLKKPNATRPVGYSSSTAQYYHDCACQMGMVDGRGGVFFSSAGPSLTASAGPNGNAIAPPAAPRHHATPVEPPRDSTRPLTSVPTSRMTAGASQGLATFGGANAQSSLNQGSFLMPGLSSTMAMALLPSTMQREILQQACFQRQLVLAMMMTTNKATTQTAASARTVNVFPDQRPSTITECRVSRDAPSTIVQSVERRLQQEGKDHAPPAKPVPATGMVLGSPLDQKYLNPIHCFVRRHVEFFAATEQDITAPSPGRRTKVLPGQVGLRCIHCARLPMKVRVKRAVCYPPSVNGIYHCVSNMKFDHFANCRGLPAPARQEFLGLREAIQGSARRTASTSASNGNNSVKGSSTFCYYHDSALRMGLVDTEHGIRLIQDLERSIQVKLKLEQGNNASKETKAAKEELSKTGDDAQQPKPSKKKLRAVLKKNLAAQQVVSEPKTTTPCTVSKKTDIQECSTSKAQHDRDDSVKSESSSHCVSDGISALMLAANHPRAAV